MRLRSHTDKHQKRAPARALLCDRLSVQPEFCSLPMLLRRGYAGPIWQIRRASDNTTLDVYHAAGRLDRGAIASFCAGTNGFLVKAYDQSGHGRDVGQATAANQPKIYDSSTGFFTATNQIGVSFNGSSQWLERTADSFGITGDPNVIVAQLVKWGTANSDEFSFQIGNDATGQRLALYWSSGGDSPKLNFGGARETVRNSNRNERALGYELVRRAAGATISNSVLRQNGTVCTEASNTNGGNTPSYSSSTGVVIGRNGTSTNNQFYFSGIWCGLIALQSAADADQYALEQELERLRVA